MSRVLGEKSQVVTGHMYKLVYTPVLPLTVSFTIIALAAVVIW